MDKIILETQDNETEAQRLGRMIKYLRLLTGMKREDFANYLHIPLGTVRDWEQGKRKMPEYVYELIEYKVERELIAKGDDGDGE
ncbi:MAG: helix-turn-helix domain-containing protein [Lachnobacterium sp.]|nr:helix-turn-helix domain-containing protein [Lachnobacterium sp.]MDD6631526.1 helix-turn-helix domain-containing protein [Lachnobacterium sp.]